jgi:hypothetical protein
MRWSHCEMSLKIVENLFVCSGTTLLSYIRSSFGMFAIREFSNHWENLLTVRAGQGLVRAGFLLRDLVQSIFLNILPFKRKIFFPPKAFPKSHINADDIVLIKSCGSRVSIASVVSQINTFVLNRGRVKRI